MRVHPIRKQDETPGSDVDDFDVDPDLDNGTETEAVLLTVVPKRKPTDDEAEDDESMKEDVAISAQEAQMMLNPYPHLNRIVEEAIRVANRYSY